MKEIDGVKYFSEEDFDSAVTKASDEILEKFAYDSKSTGLVLTQLLVIAEFARLGAILFKDDSNEDE